jgi:hypothetical protein
MNGAAAHAATRIVRAEFDRVVTARDSLVGPEELA